MDTENLPKALQPSILKLGDIELSCAVLDDKENTRVLTATSIFHAFGRSRKGMNDRLEIDGTKMPPFLAAKNLIPHIKQELIEWTKPIKYMSGDRVEEGYNARILPKMCTMYLEARRALHLVASQEKLAVQSEILQSALSDMGIVALIDEATGYQKKKDEYRDLVSLYIAEAMRPWVKTFREQYYKDIYRLMGWDWSLFTSGVYKNHPQLVGKITNDLVYNKLPHGVLDELNKINPKDGKGNRSHKHHQFLSENIGYRELIEHLGKISAFASMYGFGEYKKAKAHIDQLVPDLRTGAQIGLDFPILANDFASISNNEAVSFTEVTHDSSEKEVQLDITFAESSD